MVFERGANNSLLKKLYDATKYFTKPLPWTDPLYDASTGKEYEIFCTICGIC